MQKFIDNLGDKYLGDVITDRIQKAEEQITEEQQIPLYPECFMGLDPFNYLREVSVTWA